MIEDQTVPAAATAEPAETDAVRDPPENVPSTAAPEPGGPVAEEAPGCDAPEAGDAAASGVGEAGSDGPVALAARARPDDAEAVLARLRAAPADAEFVVDASAVEQLTTPLVLALVAAARARAEGGAPLAVARPSPAFVDAFSDLGLFQDLMKMEFRT